MSCEILGEVHVLNANWGGLYDGQSRVFCRPRKRALAGRTVWFDFGGLTTRIEENLLWYKLYIIFCIWLTTFLCLCPPLVPPPSDVLSCCRDSWLPAATTTQPRGLYLFETGSVAWIWRESVSLVYCLEFLMYNSRGFSPAPPRKTCYAGQAVTYQRPPLAAAAEATSHQLKKEPGRDD